MSVPKPTYPDGVAVKVDDLQRALAYTRSIEQGLSRYFGPGIISGTAITYTYTQGVSPLPNTITVTVQGPAVICAENKELIILEANQAITRTFVYPAANTSVDIYIYESSINTVSTRQNLANIPRPVSEQSVYSLSDVVPSPSTPGKRAKIATIINPLSPVTYKAMSTLQHTDTFLDGVYTGPRLNASSCLVPFSILEDQLAPGCISTSKIQDRAITSIKIQTGAIRTEHLYSESPLITTPNLLSDGIITNSKIPDGVITPSKLTNNLRMSIPYYLETSPWVGVPICPPSSGPSTPFVESELMMFNFASSTLNFPSGSFLNLTGSTPSGVTSKFSDYYHGSAMFGHDLTTMHQGIKSGYDSPPYNWRHVMQRPVSQQVAANTPNVLFTNQPLPNGIPVNFWVAYNYSLDLEYISDVYITDKAWTPNYIKLYSGVVRSIDYPETIIVHGTLPFLRRLSRPNTSVGYSTPFIVAPDGYLISTISVQAVYDREINKDYTEEIRQVSSISSVDTYKSFDLYMPVVRLYTYTGGPCTIEPYLKGPIAKLVGVFESLDVKAHNPLDRDLYVSIHIVLQKLPANSYKQSLLGTDNMGSFASTPFLDKATRWYLVPESTSYAYISVDDPISAAFFPGWCSHPENLPWNQ